MTLAGLLCSAIGESLLEPFLWIFGATSDVLLPYARQYAGITLLGMPFLIVTNGMSNLIQADGSPKYSMLYMVSGAIANMILDPIFIFICKWSVFGAALATVIGQILSFALAVGYLWKFKTIRLTLHSTLRTFQQRRESGSHYHCTDSSQPLPYLLGCSVHLRIRHPVGCLWDRHENKRHIAVYYRWHFPRCTA